MNIFGVPDNNKNKKVFEPGAYVMTKPMTQQDIRVLTADIVAYAIMNKVPDELSNKIKVEQYLLNMLKRLPESVLTYVWKDPNGHYYPSHYGYVGTYKKPSIPDKFIYLEDPKNPKGNPIEYPIQCIDEFFSF